MLRELLKLAPDSRFRVSPDAHGGEDDIPFGRAVFR
jgi:hypothetical protein